MRSRWDSVPGEADGTAFLAITRERPMYGPPIVIDELLQRVRGEYLEMPGLRLTLAQAARFWCLDHPTCACLLDALVNARFLVLTSDGLYTRSGFST